MKLFHTVIELLELHREVHNRGPVYCEYCPAVLQSRNQYTQHVHSVHQAETAVSKQKGFNVNERVDGAVSTQSFPDLNGHELAENLFRTRAQSADHRNHDAVTVKSKPLALSEHATGEERPVRCEVCRHLYYTVPHLVEHWMNSNSDRDHSFCVMPCPLCNYTANGVLVGVEHMREFHPHILETLQRKSEKANIKSVSYNNDESEGGSSSTESEELRSPKKKHRCKTCSASFTKPSDLVRHIRVHT
ncbi:zinc finger, C2H2 type, partial [Oesophagostomum dentatum]